MFTQHGSATFEAYSRTLRKIMWADFVDEQMRIAREESYRASLVSESFGGCTSLVAMLAATRKPAAERAT